MSTIEEQLLYWRNEADESIRKLLDIGIREDNLIRAMREIKTALKHGEDQIVVMAWCLARCEKAIKDYEKRVLMEAWMDHFRHYNPDGEAKDPLNACLHAIKKAIMFADARRP